jgi:hypothetical protein
MFQRVFRENNWEKRCGIMLSYCREGVFFLIMLITTLSLTIRSTIISLITGIKSSVDIFIYYLQIVTQLIRVFLQFTCRITSFPYP